jgi:hypothetical protein
MTDPKASPLAEYEAFPIEVVEFAGAAEAATILDTVLERIWAWRKAGKLPEPYQVLACSPVWAKSDLVRFAAGATDGFVFRPPLPVLAGTAEAAEMLGVTKRSITRWRADGKFVAPYQEIAAGPLWLRSTIENWERPKR